MTTTENAAALETRAAEDALEHVDQQQVKSELSKIATSSGVDLLTIGAAFAASGYFPDARRQAQAVTKILAGAELGIGPVASMLGFYCIPRRKEVNGQWVEEIELTMSANLRAAVIKRDKRIDLQIVEHTNEACEIEVAVFFAGQWQRRGSVRFTIEDAKRAKVRGKGGAERSLADGPMWKSYPADMLYAAVMRRISKRYAPHLFIGDTAGDEGSDLVYAESSVALQHGEPRALEGAPEHSEYWDAPADPPEPDATAVQEATQEDAVEAVVEEPTFEDLGREIDSQKASA